MQGGTLFSGIDLLPAEHGIDPRLQTGLFCQLKKEPEGMVCDSIL